MKKYAKNALFPYLESVIAHSQDKSPIQLCIGLDKVSYGYPETRYFSVFLPGMTDITDMVAEALSLRISKSKDCFGSLIIHGGGMDMGFKLQSEVHKAAYAAGYPDLVDPDTYKYLGKRRGRKYILK